MKGSTISEPPTGATDGGTESRPDLDSLPEALRSLISDTESIHDSFRSPDGVTRLKGSERADIGQTVVTVVTDRRILLSTPFEDGSGVVSLAYEDVASITDTDGALVLQTTEGIGIEWPLSSDEPASPALLSHLRWIGELRGRIQSYRNDVELVAGEIRTLADDLAWEEALTRYRRARDRLDDLLNDIYCTRPVPQHHLAPEITDIERTLEKAHTRLFIERGESRLELARQLLENGDYEQGRKVLEQAQNDRSRARRYHYAVQRGDAFQFGTQRSLEADLKSLGWKVESVAAEPVRQAHEAKIKARAAADPAEALPHWERAFRRYGHVLTLEWGSDERNFAGDPERVRRDLDRAAARLVELHGARADACWNRGADRQEDGEHKAALEHCLDAQRHLERAHELATEFRPDRADRIASRLETMTEEVVRMRRDGPAESEDSAASQPSRADDATEVATDADPAGSDAGEDGERRALPSASELAEMDTHHDITLDSEDLQVSSADGDDPLDRADAEREEETESDASDGERDEEAAPDATDGETTSH